MAPSLAQETSTNFVEAMAVAANQVSVVTTDGKAGRFGVTISTFASISSDPPLVMACVNRRSPIIEAIDANKCFCVNLLSTKQDNLANCFAGRLGPDDSYDFKCARWSLAKTQSPVLANALANFDCVVDAAYDAGTHRILIGKVVEAKASKSSPLVFSDRCYQSLQTLAE